MKKILTVLFCAVILSYAGLYAADDTATYNTTTKVLHESMPGGIAVVYSGTTTTTSVAGTDSVGDMHTKAMWIGDCKYANAYFTMSCYNSARGTVDYNVYVYYSDDLKTWTLGTAASGKIKDQLTTTAVTDTLNIQVGARDLNFDAYQWMAFKFDAQSGNPVGTYVTWRVALQKNPDTPIPVARVVSTNSSPTF